MSFNRTNGKFQSYVNFSIKCAACFFLWEWFIVPFYNDAILSFVLRQKKKFVKKRLRKTKRQYELSEIKASPDKIELLQDKSDRKLKSQPSHYSVSLHHHPLRRGPNNDKICWYKFQWRLKNSELNLFWCELLDLVME